MFPLAFLLLSGLACPEPSCAQLGDYLQFPHSFPERDVITVGNTRPEWKKEWDNGRRLARAGELRAAAESYRRLLASRNNIEEARWELALMLARLDDWEPARNELELLVELAPENGDYLSALGLALRRTGQPGRALDIFGKVRERYPDNLAALAGQTQGLLEAGRKKDALPLLQEIVVRKPEDRESGLALAALAYELGQLELARKVIVPLAAAKKAELETLLLAARLHDGVGKEKESAAYWEKVLGTEPGNREAHAWLARYQEGQGRADKVLPHLLALLEQEPHNVTILGRICRIYRELPNRFDEAYPYYEKYLKGRPDDFELIRSLTEHTGNREEDLVAIFRLLLETSSGDLGIFNKLAAQWAAAGEPERARAAWERLARIEPDRLEVYRSLSRLLERGQEEQLVRTLKTIHRLAPDDQETIGRLARLMVSRGEPPAGLEYYNKLEKTGYTGIDLYSGRAALHEKMGQHFLALADYKKYLALSPGADEVFRHCLFLAGELGDVAFLNQAQARVADLPQANTRLDDTLLLAEAYATARDFNQAMRQYREVLSMSAVENGRSAPKNSDLMHRARLGMARLYRRTGLPFEEEQLHREALLTENDQSEFLRRLFELSLHDAHLSAGNARVWLEQFLRQPGASAVEGAILQARLLLITGERRAAEQVLSQLLGEITTDDSNQSDTRETGFSRQAGLLLARMLLDARELAAAEQQCLAAPGAESDPDVLALLYSIYLKAGEKEAAEAILLGLQQTASDEIKLLQAAELLEQLGLTEAQKFFADKVLLRWPHSLRAGFIKAEALAREANPLEALQVGAALAVHYPGNASVSALKARLSLQAGLYRDAAALAKSVLTADPGRLDILFLLLRCEVAQGNHAAAARIVQDVYHLTGSQLLAKRLTESGIPLPKPRERSFWQIITFDNPPYDLVEEMLKAETYSNQKQPERTRTNELLSSILAWLRWEKKFRETLPATSKH